MLLKEKILIVSMMALLGLSGCGLGDRGVAIENDSCAIDINDPACDQDNDGLTNKEEDLLGTDKRDKDTDGDGVDDGVDGTNSNAAKSACLPRQSTDYLGYDNTNSIWIADDCDGDGALNGEEDDYTAPNRLSNPYDASN